MATQPLVSIITPCYNGEEHVSRLIDSILKQTCTDAEFILVNDGSADATEDVVMSYRRDLEKTLRGFTYVKQENQGLGGAINAGLQQVNGKYLVWPDADDFLEPASLAMRAAILDGAAEFAVVTSDAYVREEGRLDQVQHRVSDDYEHNHDPHQFEHLLQARSIFTSGTHMARVDAFDQTHPGRRIFPAPRGQNWQMLLPLYHRYKRFYLDEPLYNYVVRTGSMSSGNESYEARAKRYREHNELLRAVVESIDMLPTEREKHFCTLDCFYQRAVFNTYCRYRKFGAVPRQVALMAANRNLRFGDMKRMLRSVTRIADAGNVKMKRIQ